MRDDELEVYRLLSRRLVGMAQSRHPERDYGGDVSAAGRRKGKKNDEEHGCEFAEDEGRWTEDLHADML